MSLETESESVARPPLGIRVVCWARIVLVFLEFILMFWLLANFEVLYVAVLLVAIVGEIVIMYGLWMLQLWGWVLALVWYSISVIQSGASLLSGSMASLVGIAFSLITMGLVLTNYQSFR